MIFKGIEEFDGDLIFDCGQCFRWHLQGDGSYTGIAGDKVANVKFEKGTLEIKGPCLREGDLKEEAFWRNYFDLDRDYGAIRKALKAKDPIMQKAAQCGKGIRILRQDRWETLVSFIISANNNIGRIKKNIESLARERGRYLGEYMGRKFFTLPSPEVLKKCTEEDLAPCRLGYRSKYLIETAKIVNDDNGRVIEEKLNDYCGVGPKVGHCISLFAFSRFDSFPIDVWVKRIMEELYGLKTKKEMEVFAEKAFGENRGIAQQYLFYYMRYVHGTLGEKP